MSGGTVVGAVLVGLAYFAVLMLVVLEHPPAGSRRGRHRRDQPEGAR
ncbi:MAG: hypothetical protein ACRDRV_11620 [Pseudonocardiaceae bacterium]